MIKLAYLDSNDFSSLSNERLSEEDAQILLMLREKRDSGHVRFFASAYHIAEAVQASENFRDSAIRRATLIRELCGSNTLITPDELHRREILKATSSRNGRLSLSEITAGPDDWFGIALSKDPGELTNLAETVSRMTRPERRALKPKLKRLWSERPSPDPLIKLLGEDFILDWIVSGADPSALDARIKETVRDPFTLFDNSVHAPLRRTLYDAVRKTGANWISRIDRVVESSVPTLISLVHLNAQFDLKSAIGRTISADSLLTGVARQVAGNSLDSWTDTDVLAIARTCPSLTLQAEVLRSYALSRYEATLMRIKHGNLSLAPSKDSDFADFLHCAYAPYFDVFRCDSRFGELLKRHKPMLGRAVTKRAGLLTSL